MKIILFLPGIYGIIIYFRLRDYNAVTVASTKGCLTEFYGSSSDYPVYV